MKKDRFYRFIFLSIAIFLLQHSVLAQEWKRTSREIQQSLANKGFDPGSVDGVWGKKSAAALRAFQKAQNLRETGVLDEPTANSLFGFRDAVRRELLKPVPQAEEPAVEQDKDAPSNISRISGESQTGEKESTTAPTDKTLSSPPAEKSVTEQKIETFPVESDVTKTAGAVPIAATPPSPAPVGTYLIWGAALLGIALWYRRRKRKKPGVSLGEPAPKNSSSLSSRHSDTTDDRQHSTASSAIIKQRDNAKSDVHSSPALAASISAHNAKVVQAITGQKARLALPARPYGASPARWVPAGTEIRIGPHLIKAGMIYVGGYLPKQGASRENENCMIDPQLSIARLGDVAGATMGYWPSYSHISPEARRSYLDWLAGSRSDPTVYIGYVFLYFYGLERRLMLEPDAPDAAAVLSEVRRLLDIYGANGSFRRYARALITAYEVRSGNLPSQLSIEIDESSYEIPMSLKVALALQVGSDAPMLPDLLLAYVVAHPETRVRTPAKRVEQRLLKQMFADELRVNFPKGLKITGKKGRKLTLDYRACSGSFEMQIQPFGLDLIDVTQRSEPIDSGRKAFEACMDRLDDYSRALGRAEGLRPTLSAIAKLPASYRQPEAEALPDKPLMRLEAMSADGTVTLLGELASVVGMDPEKIAGRARLVELSATLAALGYGCTADPAFSLKAAKREDPVAVFALGRALDTAAEPSDAYKPAQLSAVLGLLIAYADGQVHDLELARLHESIDGVNGISSDERSRLKAELKVHAADPARLADFSRRLKDMPSDAREGIASAIVAVATADGALHPKEVSQLEKLFRQMSLDPQSLYSRLHGQVSPSMQNASASDDDLPLVIAPTSGASGALIPPPPSVKAPAFRVDTSRLDAIRQETRAASNVLADIFVDETDLVEVANPPAADAVPTGDEFDLFEGLERRYGLLLLELQVRGEWSASEFDRLVREAGLMPAAAIEVLNNWSLDMFDDLLLEGDEPVVVNLHLLPSVARPGDVTIVEERLSP